eukprot:Tamp_07935.p1 GENE.Tamp_07935~~Tamp_07935.p1  ORF type:complete len:635 (-),score=153.61 Tamp_07935:506-2266(-)
MQAARRRRALADVAGRRRQEARDNIAAVLAETHGSTKSGPQQDVLGLGFLELQKRLKDGKLSAQTVLASYRAQAGRAHARVNCLTEFLPEAGQVAQALDEQRKASRTVGGLHGIPVSIKETIFLQGHDCIAGLAKRCGLLQDADSEAVQLLRAAGAVPFCRTNTPQTNLSYGCSNPIFGATVHPMDAARTPGGSSGGEAALMALGGSILGLGTDIGGSVRVPAAFCGVCGFKPGGGRITRKGYYSALAGQSGVMAAFGPMSPEVSAIAECMAALTSGGSSRPPPDASVAPVPWNWGEYSSTRKLRIGYYVADGFIAATPACVRAVHQACDMLRSRGHEVLRFRPPSAIEGLLLFIKLLTADGGKAVSDALEDEIIDDSLRAFVQGVRVSGSLYKGVLLPRLLRRKGKLRTADLLEAQGRCTTSQLWNAQAQRTALSTLWERAVAEAGVDVLVTPAHVMLAPAPHVVASSGITLCYTQIFNVLDFPAGTVPVGHATAEDEAAMASWPRGALQEQFADELDELIRQRLVYGEQNDAVEAIVRANSRGIAGLPTAVQCVALPWQEEKCLRIMRELQADSAGRVPRPPPA